MGTIRTSRPCARNLSAISARFGWLKYRTSCRPGQRWLPAITTSGLWVLSTECSGIHAEIILSELQVAQYARSAERR